MSDFTFVIGCGIFGFLVYIMSPIVFRAIMNTEGEKHKAWRLSLGEYYYMFAFQSLNEPKWTE